MTSIPWILIAGLAGLAGCAPPAVADPAGRSTHDESIGLASRDGINVPVPAAGSSFAVQALGSMSLAAVRSQGRRSLAFFAQLTDGQLTDEMSPARIEFLRPIGAFLGAWRPHEALAPHTVDQAVRNISANAVSRVEGAAGRRAHLQFAIVTGDLADNGQHNEIRLGVRVLDGGHVDPFSGARVEAGNRCPGAPRRVVRRLNAAVAARRYTGVQDAADWPGRPAAAYGAFYDPDAPSGSFGLLPRYPGLLDRAQRPYRARGLSVPWYSARGNHDALAQGFFSARWGGRIATGCRKVMPLGSLPAGEPHGSDWEVMRRLIARGRFEWVPPDRDRRFASPQAFKRLHRGADRSHGYDFVAQRQLRRSRGAASYYAWSPRPGLRFIALDTAAEGGGYLGNIDHLQYRWLRRQLIGARQRNELVVVYAHHTLDRILNHNPDERAGACRPARIGCDRDPRRSTPIHFGQTGPANLRSLFLRFPNVVLMVSGHIHRNRVVPHVQIDGSGGFWEISTASHIGFPQQTRLLEVIDNGDDTLSIFGTLLDTAAPIEAPTPGTPAGGMSELQLASISRLLSMNVRAAGVLGGPVTGPGGPGGNVELVVLDPRRPG
jgi:hypothetical protein